VRWTFDISISLRNLHLLGLTYQVRPHLSDDPNGWGLRPSGQLVREEADLVLSCAVETSLESVDRWGVNNVLLQTIPSIINSFRKELTSQIQTTTTLQDLGSVTSCSSTGILREHTFKLCLWPSLYILKTFRRSALFRRSSKVHNPNIWSLVS